MPLESGQTLNNRYRIERLLGQGGFGAVYLAWDLNLDGAVALKENFEARAASGDPSFTRQFQLEARLLFQLRHPNLPRVSDYFIIPGQGQYLVMDYIEGEDLEMMLERAGTALPYEKALGWIIQVGEALSYLHSQEPPIIHRDLKPANIRITRTTSSPQGQAILVDFGIAKVYNATSNTTTGARAVTLNYSPPEQYGMGKTDAQSDVYALGATAYHLLSGHAPAPAVDVMSGNLPPPTPLHQLNPAVPLEVSQAVAKAMQLNRAGRWGSVAEFTTALRSTQASAGSLVAPARQAPVSTPRPISTPQPAASDPFATALVQPEGTPSLAMETPPPSRPTGEVEIRTTPPPAPAPRSNRRRWIIGCVAAPLALACLFIFVALLINGPKIQSGRRAQETEAIPTVQVQQSPLDTNEPPPPTGNDQLPPPPTPEPQTNPTPAAEQSGDLGQGYTYPSIPISPDNIEQLSQLARWGSGTLNAVAVSGDDRLLAVASSLGLYLYDAQSMHLLDMIENPNWINHVSLSPDGKHAATTTWETTIQVWSLDGVNEDGCPEGGCPLALTLEGHEDAVAATAFAPDGKTLASVSYDDSLRTWNLADGQELLDMEGHTGGAVSLAYSPDGALLASGDSAGVVRLWDAHTGDLLQEITPHSATVIDLAFAPGGEQQSGYLLASVSEDEKVILYDVSGADQGYALKERHTVGNGEAGYYRVGFSADSALLMASNWNSTVHIWQTEDGKLVTQLEQDTDGITSLAMYHNSAQLIAGSFDGTLIRWDYESGEQQVRLEDQGPLLDSLAFAPDGSGFAVGTDDGGVQFFNPMDSTPLWETYEHDGTVQALAFSADSALLASGGADNDVRLWNVKDGAMLNDLQTESEVHSVAVHTNSDNAPAGGARRTPGDPAARYLIAAGLDDGQILVWGAGASGQTKLIATLEAHSSAVTALAFAPDGSYLISGSQDGRLRAWGTGDGSMISDIEIGHEGVRAVKFSPDGAQLVSAHVDSSAAIFAVGQEDTPPIQLNVDAGILYALAFTPDGQVLAAGADWSRVVLWNPQDGSLLSLLYGMNGAVTGVAFSPDGYLMVTVSFDGTIQIWGVAENP